MDRESFILSFKIREKIKDLVKKDYVNFSNVIEDHDSFSNMKKKDFGNSKIKTQQSFWIDKLCILRAKW